jgi:hypothetical protein
VFVVVGLLGLQALKRGPENASVSPLRMGYMLFFTGTLLIGFGSAYYHLAPSNHTLLWDRIPMAISFMAFMSAIAGEYINSRFGRLILWPLILLGIASVLYWIWTESYGSGDLRPYTIAQFMPALLTPVIILLFGAEKHGNRYIWLALIAYAIAKALEIMDVSIWSVSGMTISGHTLKHLFAGLGTYFFLLFMNSRRLNQADR